MHVEFCGMCQVTTQNLERVRRIKNRMVRLTTKVETIRELLEKFLDDDSDMKDMNLTARVSHARLMHGFLSNGEAHWSLQAM